MTATPCPDPIVPDRVVDARAYLCSLIGAEVKTLTGRPNRILDVRGNFVVVGTRRSPKGKAVPIKAVQDAIDQLYRRGEVSIDVDTVGYRSAFVGAVLLTLPGAHVLDSRRIAVPKGRFGAGGFAGDGNP